MTTAVLIDYIDQHRDRFGVEPICTVLRRAGMQIAPSSYYAAKTRPPSARAIADAQHLEVIRRTHTENYGVYGVRKMHAELNRHGHRIARCTVHRLMRAEGLRGISRAKGPRTTVPGTGPDTRPDLLDRDFKAPAPNRIWVADITYCRTFAGWVYAAFVIDVYSRRVVAGSCRRACAPTLRWTLSRWGCGPVSTLARTPPASLHTPTREFSTSPCATPGGWPKREPWRQSDPPVTPS